MNYLAFYRKSLLTLALKKKHLCKQNKLLQFKEILSG